MYKLFCDSNCELWHTEAEALGLEVIRMPYVLDGKEYYYDLGKETDFAHFYQRMREGAVPTTSAINAQNYIDYFEPFLAQGQDIYYVTFSHKLSNTFAEMDRAIAQLKEEEAKIEAISNGEEFDVTCTGFNKGGLTASMGTYAVFVPAKEIRMGYVKELDKYVGKKLRLSQPQQMLAAEREIIDEAYAGDIIGVFDPGIFSIGDTVTVPGKKFRFMGIPTFEPEHFMRVSPMDTMKRKQFIKGTEQIAQEGAIQIFKLPYAGMEEVIVGVMGTLQFDVFEYRMKSEYGVTLRMTGLPYDHLRRISACPGDPKDLTLCADAALLEDFRGRSLIAYSGEWPVGYLLKHNPGLELSESLSE